MRALAALASLAFLACCAEILDESSLLQINNRKGDIFWNVHEMDAWKCKGEIEYCKVNTCANGVLGLRKLDEKKVVEHCSQFFASAAEIKYCELNTCVNALVDARKCRAEIDHCKVNTCANGWFGVRKFDEKKVVEHCSQFSASAAELPKWVAAAEIEQCKLNTCVDGLNGWFGHWKGDVAASKCALDEKLVVDNICLAWFFAWRSALENAVVGEMCKVDVCANGWISEYAKWWRKKDREKRMVTYDAEAEAAAAKVEVKVKQYRAAAKIDKKAVEAKVKRDRAAAKIDKKAVEAKVKQDRAAAKIDKKAVEAKVKQDRAARKTAKYNGR